jgi:UTP--glucose-1-phosphate uridylyltransferase
MIQAAETKIRQRMHLRGIPPSVTEDFIRLVRQVNDEPSYVPLHEITAPDGNLILEPPADSEQRRDLEERGREMLKHVVVIKLNGGRSTTMGTSVPKGILLAKDGLCYLEIVIRQVEAVRPAWQVQVPLILMNSFFTDGPTLELVERIGASVTTFIQNQVPRLVEGSLVPLDTGTDEDWVPPGHGDVYFSLYRSGLLEELRSQGKRWAFISNLDNLAASLEPWILGLIEREGIDFLLEVTERTPADRKGGTLVVRNGQLDLLEIAQVPPEQREAFMDIERFAVFNTNNIWVDLEKLENVLSTGSLNLPLIRNRKRILSTEVIQLETAMGAAVGGFPQARGLKVDRSRFFPTKKVSDLFVLQSDACVLDAMNRLQRNPLRPLALSFMPQVSFDSEFANSPDKLAERFEDCPSVSLVYASSLDVSGSVYFERDVKIEGDVEISAPPGKACRIGRGSVLRNCTFPY